MTSIGVTGHRVLAEPTRVAAGIDEALARIATSFRAGPCRVISALAEGADRLVVRRAFDSKWWNRVTLLVPLPRPANSYSEDFDSEESREEFEALLEKAGEVTTLTSTGASRTVGYRAVADYVLSHSDVLIAVWDGADPTNDVGTASVVARARHQGLPLAWVRAGNRRPRATEPTSLGDEQGTVTFERF